MSVHELLQRHAVYFTFVHRQLTRKVSHYAHFEREHLHAYLLHRNYYYHMKRLATQRP